MPERVYGSMLAGPRGRVVGCQLVPTREIDFIQCLGLSALPEEDEWFCPECKNVNDIVCAGGKAMKVNAT